MALAADSAVTLWDGTSRAPKIYNTVNKLFTLSKHEPVGVMIYGSAELGGLPVETAVKVFRDELGRDAFGSLQEYADSFLEFLGSSARLFPRDRQDRFVRRGSFRFLSRVLQEELQSYINSEQVTPVVSTVLSLPKNELAEMAETLVNLTSFRQRVSPDAETVGGPVDVAVISRGDGFIWIKRKHYFQAELNHQFFNNYFNPRK